MGLKDGLTSFVGVGGGGWEEKPAASTSGPPSCLNGSHGKVELEPENDLPPGRLQDARRGKGSLVSCAADPANWASARRLLAERAPFDYVEFFF